MKINVFAAILNFKRVNKTGTAKFKDAEVLPSKFLLRGSFTESAPLLIISSLGFDESDDA